MQVSGLGLDEKSGRVATSPEHMRAISALQQWSNRLSDHKRQLEPLKTLLKKSKIGHALFTDIERKLDLRQDWESAVGALQHTLQEWMEDLSTAEQECAALRSGDVLAFHLFRVACAHLAVLDAVNPPIAKRIRDAWEKIERIWMARGKLFHHLLKRSLPETAKDLLLVDIVASQLKTLLSEHASYLRLPEEKRRSTFMQSLEEVNFTYHKTYFALSLPHMLTANEVKAYIKSALVGTGQFASQDNYARWIEQIGITSFFALDKFYSPTFFWLDMLAPASHADLANNTHQTMAVLAPDLYICIRRAWALTAPTPLPVLEEPNAKMIPVRVEIDKKLHLVRSAWTSLRAPNGPEVVLFPFTIDGNAHHKLRSIRQHIQAISPAFYRQFFLLYASDASLKKEPKTLLETMADDAVEALVRNPKDVLASQRMRAVENYFHAASDVDAALREVKFDLSDPRMRLSTVRAALYLGAPYLDFILDGLSELMGIVLEKHNMALTSARERLIELYWPTRMSELRATLLRNTQWNKSIESKWLELTNTAQAQGILTWQQLIATLAIDQKQPAYRNAQMAYGTPPPGERLLQGFSAQDHAPLIELGIVTPSARKIPDAGSYIRSTENDQLHVGRVLRMFAFHQRLLFAILHWRTKSGSVPLHKMLVAFPPILFAQSLTFPDAKLDDTYEDWHAQFKMWWAATFAAEKQRVFIQDLNNWFQRHEDPYADYTEARLESLTDRIRFALARQEFQNMSGAAASIGSDHVSSILKDYVLQGGWTAAWHARWARPEHAV
jgi:hypothetical protein